MAADIFTAKITKNTLSAITGQYFDLEMPFAFPRYGNECKPYINGRDYMQAVAEAIRGAKSFILITDWQLNYDVELDQRGHPGHPGRLSELLAAAIQRGVHIRVLLYDSVEGVLDTHDDMTQERLRNLPRGKGSIEIMLQNSNTGRFDGSFFSHHQKSVVVDGKVAFLGGLDIAYGRWDTNAFNVVMDPAIHVINDAYNAQLVPARALNKNESMLLAGKDGRPGFHPPYAANGHVFDERFQPRQPWQDVALHVRGPAAYDVFVNFVLRWNSFAASGLNSFDAPMAVDWFKRAKGADHLVDPLTPGSGSAVVQICRSAAAAQLRDELALWDAYHSYIHDDWKKSDPSRRKSVEAARLAWVGQHQTSILDAMINCIRSAQGFIYIENQFFMSDCGRDQYGNLPPSKNKIVAELANAVGRAIYAERPFHIWLVLPEHPEGIMETEGPSSQAWWSLQGVKRGRNSLVNRINRFILGKYAKTWNLKSIPTESGEIDKILKAKSFDRRWENYLTVLNLRNYGHSDRFVMTEMIYVHSKLLIVDDSVAIIGSANINDRSLNGNGDTELAAVVVDTDKAKMTDVGDGISLVTRDFARNLRIQLWKKHLGTLVDSATTGVQKTDLPSGVSLESPLSPLTITAIKNLADSNLSAYEEVFLHTPRNGFRKLTEGRETAYPILSAKDGTRDFSKPPRLRSNFMNSKSHDVEKAIKFLASNVRGFFTTMPLEWGYAQGDTPNSPLNYDRSIAVNAKDEIENGAT